jgi:chemotaxis protein CheY-P-specific phosphatase CheC
MSDALFTEDEHDQFSEIVNIAMGRTSATLADAFDGFVNLRVPEIRSVDAADVDSARQRLELAYERISVLRQEFFGELAGDITVIFGPASYAALRQVLGLDERDGDGQQQREELLLELGNALASTCVLEMGALLGMRTAMRAPRVAAFDVAAPEAVLHLFGDLLTWSGKTILIDIVFHLEAHDVSFELMITLAPHCVVALRRALANCA